MSDSTNDLRKAVEKLGRGLETAALREIGLILSEAHYARLLVDASKVANGDLARTSAVLQVAAACIVRNVSAQVSLLIGEEEARNEMQQEATRILTNMIEQGIEEGLRLRTEAMALGNKHSGNTEAWERDMEKLMKSTPCTSIAVPEDFSEVRH